MNIKLTRAKLEALVEDLIEKTVGPCQTALQDANSRRANRRGDPRRRDDPDAPGPAEGEGDFREGTPQRGEPDEVVAIGAAIQGGVLTGEVKDVLLLDVTPSPSVSRRSAGHDQADREEHDDPDQKEPVFSTAADNQPAVSIHVLQGERSMAGDNRTLGRFELVGFLPPRAACPRLR